MAEIMEQALDIALDKKDMKRKRARRLEREAKRRGETPREKARIWTPPVLQGLMLALGYWVCSTLCEALVGIGSGRSA